MVASLLFWVHFDLQLVVHIRKRLPKMRWMKKLKMVKKMKRMKWMKKLKMVKKMKKFVLVAAESDWFFWVGSP